VSIFTLATNRRQLAEAGDFQVPNVLGQPSTYFDTSKKLDLIPQLRETATFG
jgi:hypothetical protein